MVKSDKKLLRSVIRRVHPDLFNTCDLQQQRNQSATVLTHVVCEIYCHDLYHHARKVYVGL
jgi:hypothetical protein